MDVNVLYDSFLTVPYQVSVVLASYTDGIKMSETCEE